jgi:DNA topoisomerase-3
MMERRLREMVGRTDPAELDRFLDQSFADVCELAEAARSVAATRRVDGGVIRNTRDDVKTLGTCPACGGDVIRGKQAFGCSNWRNGCKFTLWPDTLAPMGRPNLTDRDVAALLKGRTMLKFERQSGSQCARPVELAKRDDGKWFAKVDREAEAVPESLGNCPVEGCGGAVVEAPKSFGCSRWREGCKFALWRDSLEKLGGATLDRPGEGPPQGEVYSSSSTPPAR